jgi:hypothetical protein
VLEWLIVDMSTWVGTIAATKALSRDLVTTAIDFVVQTTSDVHELRSFIKRCQAVVDACDCRAYAYQVRSQTCGREPSPTSRF